MKKVLVVDDRRNNRAIIVALLDFKGYESFEAATGEEALVKTRAERPDLVITDIVMPRMDGYEFVRQLRADALIAKTPVIFHSANFHDPEARELARACGVDQLVSKPAEPEELWAAVESALGNTVPAMVPRESFRRDHLRLMTDKLTQKVVELELLNRTLEQRVVERTAELQSANAALQTETGGHRQTIAELQDALTNVRTLSGLLPICCSCKDIRNDQGYWLQLESYFQQHSDAKFSHGICPKCAEKLYPGYSDSEPAQ
jgi:CheY-like chemotaxis protein